MRNPSLQVFIKLEPVVHKDADTGFYVAHFKDFPQATAYDETEKKAILRLIELFQVMLRNEKEKILGEIINSQKFDYDLNMVTA